MTVSPRRRARGRTSAGDPNPVDVHVGGRIRLRRLLIGMTQEMLGAALGLTFQQVQKYERGANRIGSSRLFDLSRVLDVPIGFFFEDMPEEVQAQTPSLLIHGSPELPIPEPERNHMKRETLDLVRAYYRIHDPLVRKQVLELARALGGPED